MTGQPTPSVTRADVERIVRREFAAAAAAEAAAILDEYGGEPWQRDRERVQLAALKLATGSLDELRRHVAVAKRDYRDVLAAAEYPAYMQRSAPGLSVPDSERQGIYEADWEQYRRWFERT
jgi:hypothetical protein